MATAEGEHYQRWKRRNLHLRGEEYKRIVPVRTLTVTDVVKGPLVVLEEGVTFDLIHSAAAQANLPAHRDSSKQSRL